MSGAVPGRDPVRIAKFNRVLPRLRLDQAAYRRGEAVTLQLASPLGELCEVCLRLCHDTGRTFAQRELQLGPDTGTIVLAKVINIPEGRYAVMATPPPAQFFTTTPVKHRLPCRLFAETPADSLAGRQVGVLAELARGAEFSGRLARHVGQGAAPSAGAPVERLLLQLAGQDEADIAGLALAALGREAERRGRPVAAAARSTRPRRLRLGTPPPPGDGRGPRGFAGGWHDADGRDLVLAMLDKLAYCLAPGACRAG